MGSALAPCDVEPKETLMKIILYAALFVLFSTVAQADTLWYAIDNGSQATMNNDAEVQLTGRIGVLGCGQNQSAVNALKSTYQLSSVKFDAAPEVLESNLSFFSNNEIPLFGGAGVGACGMPSLTADRDGSVHDFYWNLRQQLESENYNEAIVLLRVLSLDDKQQSTISFHNPQQSCPNTINLHLKVIDKRYVYKPELRSLPEGQVTVSTPKELKETIIGYVTIVATAIPDSLEKTVRVRPGGGNSEPVQNTPPSIGRVRRSESSN